MLDSLGFQLGAALEPQLLTGTIDGRSVIGTLTQFPGLARSPESRVSAEVIERYTQLIAANANVRHALLTCGQP
ncbi:hypothetical protein [Nocardia sp. alder85J]|uniref:hypothetical protein n=1 Tax=Nocardia sp. alder85J TaxID=2862949 RepID=UPI0022592E2F|nr:hypothetical protein [Nocardia sp. alder85J]MCX4097602.1 hypothetical protein [Nocardia sp. alder85J]